MQFKDKEKSKNRITHIIVAIIILLLCVFMFIPTDLIVKPTLPKNALDNITVTNIDRISGTTTFTNKTGDKLEYTHYTDKQDIKLGYYTIKINGTKYTMSKKDGQIIQKLAYTKHPLSINCLKSDKDILPGTNAEITKQFIDYLITHDIYSDVTFRGYSPTTKQLTYTIDYIDEPITLALGNNGFYNTTNNDDDCDIADIFNKSLAKIIIIGICLLLVFVILAIIEPYCDHPLDQYKHTPPEHKDSSTICSPGTKKGN